MFKHMSDTSLQVLLNLYNSIWNPGVLPPSWSHSLVVPIPKPSKPSYLPSPYRPISLKSNAYKLMEKMIVRRLKWYLEYNKFLNTSQSGFRERRRTTDHILRLHDAVQTSLANKHHLLAIFIDLEKAYDMVNKNVPFKTSKPLHQCQYVHIYSCISLKSHFSGSTRTVSCSIQAFRKRYAAR